MLRNAFAILFATSSLLLAVIYTGVPLSFLRQLTIILIAITLFVVVCFSIPEIRRLLLKKGKWLFFILTTLLIQLLLITTGGFFSPYLVLIYLSFFGLSFFFSFSVALLFLVFVILLILAQTILDPVTYELLQQSGDVLTLYLASLITIIPVAYILTKQYRVKETISNTLTKQIKIEDAILTDLDELVLVADSNGKIISLNDAVERMLHKSRSELLQSSLFSVLLIKDENGSLLSDTMLFQDKESRTIKNVSLLTSFGMVKANLLIKPIESIEGESDQVSIIISTLSNKEVASRGLPSILQEAVAKHDALLEYLKNRLESRGEADLKNRTVMLIKSEEDIKTVREIGEQIQVKKIPMDVASLSRETVLRQGEYANVFNVTTDFTLVNFSSDDIASLSAGQQVRPDQITGPFFTALCDVKYTGIVLQKLLDISILVAASEKERIVRVTLERIGEKDLLLKITCHNAKLTIEDLPKLFTPYYPGMSVGTDLQYGSGLEGFIAKEISSQLRMPLQVNLTKDSTKLIFMLWITRGERTLATLATKHTTHS